MKEIVSISIANATRESVTDWRLIFRGTQTVGATARAKQGYRAIRSGKVNFKLSISAQCAW